MGIDLPAFQFLLKANAEFGDFGSTLVLGRQRLLIRNDTARDNFGRILNQYRPDLTLDDIADENVDRLIKALGGAPCQVMDNSAYEGAEVIHDLNEPLPARYKAKFDTVIDVGTLEHVFNIGTALKSMAEAVRVGGQFLCLNNADQHLGHGFWQFSPEAFFRTFCPSHGYEPRIADLHYKGQFHSLRDPQTAGRRLLIKTPGYTYITFAARRTEERPVFENGWPVQADYVAAWTLFLTRSAEGEGDMDKAESILRKALESAPDNPVYMAALAGVLRRAGRHQSGEYRTLLTRAAEQAPDLPGVLREQKQASARKGVFELVRSALDALILSVYQWKMYLMKRGKWLRFFENILNDSGPGQSARSIHISITNMFDNMDEILDWEFDIDIERKGAFELARSAPDALILSVYQWKTYLVKRRKWPRRWMADRDQMKRMASTALAEHYPSDDTKDLTAPLRVAIMVPWLAENCNNNMLRVVAGYLGGLRDNGIETVLVVTNEFSHPAGATIPHVRTDVRPYRSTLESVIGEYGSPPETLHIAPPPFLEGGNLNWFLNFQADFQPNVIFVPNYQMSSVHIHGLGKSAATVYLQTSLLNRPPYDFTRYLYLGEKRQINDSYIHPDRWHYHSFGYGNIATGSGLTRSDIGLQDEAFVVVSAGNRLEKEIDSEIVGIMANLMETDPKFTWMLIGIRDKDRIRENLGPRFEPMADRVIMNGYVRNIGDYLSLSDIYANPRRTGGAVSMALAIYRQIPALSFYGNDACNFLIDEMMQETPEDYQAQLAALAAEPSYLKQITRKQQTRFEQGHTITASAADLINHLHAARDDWRGK